MKTELATTFTTESVHTTKYKAEKITAENLASLSALTGATIVYDVNGHGLGIVLLENKGTRQAGFIGQWLYEDPYSFSPRTHSIASKYKAQEFNRQAAESADQGEG